MLIDTVKEQFSDEHYQKIRNVLNPREIDYVISHHSEPDHSESLSKVLDYASNAQLITTEKGRNFLSRMYRSNLPFYTIKDTDEISLGKSTLTFIEAPMLHWPETMMSFLSAENILFSCDLFGTQIADPRLYADLNPHIMDYAKRYFALIFRPLSKAVLNGLEKLSKLSIKTIAPSHGPLWRMNTSEIIDSYRRWCTTPDRRKVVILYASIWGGTKRMGEGIAESLTKSNIEVKIYDLTTLAWPQWGHLMTDFMEAGAIAFGSHTFLGQPFPNIHVALTLLKAINPKGKPVILYGTYGWVGGALKVIAEELKKMNMEVIEPPLEVQFIPSSEDMKKCHEIGEKLAKKIKDKMEVEK